MKRRIVSIAVILGLLAGLAVAAPAVADEPGGTSVSNYAIISVGQTGASQVTVRVQANFCPVCNPNPTGAPGCPAFAGTHQHAPGRYVVVQLKDSANNVLGMTKMVCDPTNWPLNTDHQADIVVNTSAPLPCFAWVTVEADIYCSWCGHWYPLAQQMQAQDKTGPVVSVVEWTNPSGKKTPPAGSSTLPGPKGGINEDGFYKISAVDQCMPPEYTVMVICYFDPEAPAPEGEPSATGWWVGVTDKDGDTLYLSDETVIKLTEAPGAPPSVKKMGSTKGKASAVDYHVTVPSSPPSPNNPYGVAVIVVAYDALLNNSYAVALVPPPPK